MMVFRKRVRVVLLAILAASSGACSSSMQGARHSRVLADQSRSCSSPTAGAKEAFAPGTLLLLGELHGTSEIPHLVGDLACEASLGNSAVHLGLEIAREEQLRIDSFLASAGDPADKQTLLEGKFWRRPLQDGKSSRAMLDLLDSVRRLKGAGASITVFLFEPSTPTRDRDAEMAKSILEVRAQAPNDLFLILTGNFHAMKKKTTIGTTEVIPMAFHLAQAGARVTSLVSVYPPGTAWVCLGPGIEACGSHPMSGKARGDARFIELTRDDERGYDGIFYVPSLTASPPATPRG